MANDLEEIKQLIEIYSRADEHFPLLVQQMRRLATISKYSIGTKIPKGIELYRATSHHDYLPGLITDIGCPPKNATSAYGRASTPQNPIFYSCSDKEGCLRELRINQGKIVILSKWITQSDMILHAIGYSESVFKKLGSQRSKDLHLDDEFLKSGSAQEFEVWNFFGDMFTNTHPESYRITAAITQLLLSGDFSGIRYPSLAKNGNVDNIALTPEFATNNLLLQSAEAILITKDGLSDESRIEGRAVAQLASHAGGKLEWDTIGTNEAELKPNETAKFFLKPGEIKRIYGSGEITINGIIYHIEPGYSISHENEELVMKDFRGKRIEPKSK